MIKAVILNAGDYTGEGGCGWYLAGTALQGKAIIGLNLTFMALDAARRCPPGEDNKAFGAEVVETLAHELLHVAQEVYGAVLSEAAVEKAMTQARATLPMLQYSQPSPEQVVSQAQDDLVLLGEKCLALLAALPEAARGREAIELRETLHKLGLTVRCTADAAGTGT